MADRSVTVLLRANTGQYTTAMGQASATTTRLGQTVETQTARARRGLAGVGMSAGQMAKGLAFVGVLASVGQLATSFMDFDATMSQVAASTMTTGEELDALRQLAIDAGNATQYSATEAAQGINELAKAGVSTKDIIGGGLTGALDLAAAGQIGVADAAETAAAALNIFGLEGNEIPHVADLLAAASGKAMGGVTDMAQAFNQSAVVAEQMGFSIEETTAALGLFASTGLTSSDAGTSFKTMLQSLIPRSKEAATLMNELGISFSDSQGNIVSLTEVAGQLQTGMSGLSEAQRNAAMQTIFGSDAVRAASILYEAGVPGVEKWLNMVDDSGYAAETAAKLMDNLRGDLEKLGGALETAFIQGGMGANDSLRQFTQTLTSMIPMLSDVIGSVFEVGGAFLNLGALVLGGLSPILSVVGNVVGVIGDLPAPLQAAAVAAGLLFANRGRIAGWGTSIANAARTAAGAVETAGIVAHQTGTRFGAMGAFARSATAGLGGLRAVGSGLLGAFGGPLGLAIAGVTLALGFLSSANQEASQEAADHAAQEDELKRALQENGNVIDDNVRKMRAQAAESAGYLAVAEDIGLATEDMTDAFLGQPEAIDKVTAALEKAIAAETESVQTGSIYTDMVSEKGQKYQELLETLPKYTDDVQDSIDANEQLAEAQGKTAASADDASVALVGIGEPLGEVSESAKTAADNIDALLDAMQSLRDMSLGDEEALQKYNNAVRDLGEQWADAQTEANAAGIEMVNAAGQINTATAAGSQLQDTFEGVGEAMQSAYDHAYKTAVAMGDDVPTATAKANDAAGALQSSFVELLKSMGLTDDQIAVLVGRYATLPTSLSTVITLSGEDTAIQSIGQIYDKLSELPPNTPITVTGLTEDLRQDLEDLGFKITELEDGTVVISMTTDTSTEETYQKVLSIQESLDVLAEGQTITVTALTDEAIALLEDAGYRVEQLADGTYEISIEVDSEEAIEEANGVQLAMGQVPEGVAVEFDISGDAADRLEEMGFKVEELENGNYEVSVAADTDEAESDVEEFRTDVENIPDSHHTEATSNAPAVSEDWGTLDGRIRGTPTSHKITATSNAPHQSQQFSTLTGRIRGTPRSHSTTTWSNAPWQSSNFSGLTQAVWGVPNSASTTVSSNASSVDASLRALRSRMIALDGMHSTVTVSEVRIGGAARAATGGLVRGPGTSTSDSIPMLLSDNEFVMKAAAVEKYGVAFMQAVNNGFLSGMADGGMVPRFASTRANTATAGGQPVLVTVSAPETGGGVNVGPVQVFPQAGDDPSKVAHETSRQIAWKLVHR